MQLMSYKRALIAILDLSMFKAKNAENSSIIPI